MSDVQKTQHYSNNEILLDGLKNFIPSNAKIIEPFYGRGDLVKDFIIDEYYDIDFPKDNLHYRDTLVSPPSYNGKWIITNPPYLAKNKARDKTIFELYLYDDLYKIALSTFLEAEGGILIIPINFFSDERSKNIREKFLEVFEIKRLNIYLGSMFDNTNYNVCSFAFIKKEQKNHLTQNILTFIYSDNKIKDNIILTFNKEYNYRLGGEFFNKIKKVKNIFSRITVAKPQNPTHITVVCIDKTEEPLHFEFTEKPYYGKDSDRNIATLSTTTELSEDFEKQLIETANKIISDFRAATYDLTFTNYRDRSRKRIGFTEAYQIMSLAYQILKSEG